MVKLRLKIDIVPYPARAERLVNMIYIYIYISYIYIYIYIYICIIYIVPYPARVGYGTMSIFIPGRVLPKTMKMVLVNSLLNTQHYKVRIG